MNQPFYVQSCLARVIGCTPGNQYGFVLFQISEAVQSNEARAPRVFGAIVERLSADTERSSMNYEV